jgi:hypothetical protein
VEAELQVAGDEMEREDGGQVSLRGDDGVHLCVFAIGNQQKYQKNSALFPKPQFTFFSTI